MTYIQLMIKVLEVFTKELPSDNYNELWRRCGETREEFVKGLKLDLMYLLLTKINTKTPVNPNLLKVIERQLTSYDVSFYNTLKYAEQMTNKALIEDPVTFDIISQIQSEDIADELKEDLANVISEEYYNALKENFNDNIQQILVAKPTDNVFYDIITLLPELFFTQVGYNYLPDEYKIEDDELREKCYEYVVDSIYSYRCIRIDDYGREKFRIPKVETQRDEEDEMDYEDFDLDDASEDFDEEYDEEDYEDDFEDADDYGIEEWVIDTQFTGYSGLYYSTKLISIVLNFIKNKQYDKLKKFIVIDEYIKRESKRVQGEGDYYTLVEILYDTRGISELDLNNEIFTSCKNDNYLEFFLSDPKLSVTLTDELIGRLILYYFDPTDENSINDIKNNLDNLPMRRILRPNGDRFDCRGLGIITRSRFREDNPQKTLFNADVMCEDRALVTVVYDDNDETYIPDCVLFDYIIFDCKENTNLTKKEEWEKLFNLDKPVIFINTSYMFNQFKQDNKISDKDAPSEAYLWAEYFYTNYRETFWLRDKSRFVFIMSEQNLDETLKYKCGGLTEELIPYYFKKNKKQVQSNNQTLTRKKTLPKQIQE